MGRVLDVDHVPDLDDPVLVASFSGWVDAGYAGATAVDALAQLCDGGDHFATLNLSDLSDLQATRPTVRLDEGGLRAIDWPAVELRAAKLRRDLIIVSGPEPSLAWPDVCDAIVDLAGRMGVSEAYMVGGMPALASHRRPIRVLATATSRSLAQEIGALRDDYVGPTGFQTVLQHGLGQHGVRSVGLWAQVPQYVAASASPAATSAVLRKLVELSGLEVDLTAFDEETEAWIAKIDEGLADRPDVARLVTQLEEQLDRDGPSGDDLVSEIERFLRTQED